MFKKYTSAILALVMIMALALPGVYALSSSTFTASSSQYANGTGTTGSSELQSGKTEQEVKPGVVMAVPPLNIVFQGSGAVILNPYKLNITLNAGAANDAAVATADQNGTKVYSSSSVVGIPVVVESKTGAPVLVSVKAKATKTGSAKFEFSNSDIATTEKNKKVQLWLEGKDSDSGWNTKYTSGKVGMVIFSDNPSTFTKLHVIDACTDGTTAIKGYFKVSGFMTEAPTDPWTSSDVVTASITFKFEPVSMNYKITL